jgi:hypothetical protein
MKLARALAVLVWVTGVTAGTAHALSPMSESEMSRVTGANPNNMSCTLDYPGCPLDCRTSDDGNYTYMWCEGIPCKRCTGETGKNCHNDKLIAWGQWKYSDVCYDQITFNIGMLQCIDGCDGQEVTYPYPPGTQDQAKCKNKQ